MTTNNNLTWKYLPCSSSEDRYYHTSTLFKNYIITYGGYSKKLKEYLGFKIWNLDGGSYKDLILEGDKPSYRYRHSACLFDSDKILIFGGFDGQKVLNDTAVVTIKETIRI